MFWKSLSRVFGCGKVYVNQRHDDHREQLALYSVKRFADLRDVIVPFFQEYQLRTSKRENFDKFVTGSAVSWRSASTSRLQD